MVQITDLSNDMDESQMHYANGGFSGARVNEFKSPLTSCVTRSKLFLCASISSLGNRH